jgi:hypothetical protein
MDESKKIKDKELEKDFVADISFTDLTNKIAEFIYQYTIKTQQYFFKENPKTLGNVSFWLAEQDDRTILMYNLHPRHWNRTKVILDLENAERDFYERIYNMGFNF